MPLPLNKMFGSYVPENPTTDHSPSERKWRNKKTGIMYASVKHNGSPDATVTTEANTSYTTPWDNLEEVGSSPSGTGSEGCTCHSYNADIGTTPEVLIKMGDKAIAIDACIAPVLMHLWDNGIHTLGCCCGHNGKFGTPSIVLAEGVDNYSRIRELIKQKDSRHFELTQWKRVIV